MIGYTFIKVRTLGFWYVIFCFLGIGKVWAQDSLSNSIATTDVYIDGENVGFSSTIKLDSSVAVGYVCSNAKNSDLLWDFEVHYRTQCLLVTNANYFEENATEFTPTGLTVSNGLLLNKNISDELDGLVVLYKGQLKVFNLKSDKVGIDLKTFNLSDTRSFQAFMEFCSLNKCSVFQTHLLAHRNSNLVCPTTASKRSAFRKTLVILEDESELQTHVLYQLNNRVYSLFELTSHLLKLNESKNVTAIINFDTGAVDFLKVYSEPGKRLTNRDGNSNNYLTELSNFLLYIKKPPNS